MTEVTQLKRVPKVHPTRFKEATYVHNTWHVTPEAGVALEAVLEPEFWSHVSAKLRRGDFVHVEAEDGAYHVVVKVEACGREYANVSLWHVPPQANRKAVAVPPSLTEAYAVKWGGPHHKFRVLRVTDNVVMQHGFNTEDEAKAWLVTNGKALAA